MANDISANPWKLDTVPFSYSSPVKVTNINWTEQVAPADELILTQTNGKVVAQSKAQQANFAQNFGPIGWVQRGLQLTKLDSGQVTVNIGAGKG